MMKRQKSIRVGVENLEHKALLSAGVVPHVPEHHQTPSAVVDVARPATHLIGTVVLGQGTVHPMGWVHASVNLAHNVVTLSNGRGSVKLQMTHVHKYGPTTVTASAYKIMQATRQFKSIHGQGPTSLVVTKLGGRIVSWSESFW
jgi:hypothetical protein